VAEDMASELDELLSSSRIAACWYMENVPAELRALIDERVAKGNHSWSRYIVFLENHGVTGASAGRLVTHFTNHKHP